MSVLDDPRVTLHTGISDIAYHIEMEEGYKDVCEIDGEWVLFPIRRAGQFDPSDNASWDAWVATLPRFATAELAVAEALR